MTLARDPKQNGFLDFVRFSAFNRAIRHYAFVVVGSELAKAALNPTRV